MKLPKPTLLFLCGCILMGLFTMFLGVIVNDLALGILFTILIITLFIDLHLIDYLLDNAEYKDDEVKKE